MDPLEKEMSSSEDSEDAPALVPLDADADVDVDTEVDTDVDADADADTEVGVNANTVAAALPAAVTGSTQAGEGEGTVRLNEAAADEVLTKKKLIKIQDVLGLATIANGYLCTPEENIYNIRFTRFRIRDLENGMVLYETRRLVPTEIDSKPEENPGTFIRYRFSPSFLQLKEIGATVEFTVGSKAVKNFRMIERHFFRDTLLKSFDFDFGFCIPNSRNTCEHIYELPELSEELVCEMISHPYETQSDSFYFVDNKLIMHQKAEYAYDAQQ
ncbi:protein unc-119 homolog B-like [Latimeria chalumnae]|uniref:protein unc-119 homolog B-like n=1 Tax=Latimeria chalumnae TaxID=7897 RepID=UPI00313BEAAC